MHVNVIAGLRPLMDARSLIFTASFSCHRWVFHAGAVMPCMHCKVVKGVQQGC